LYRKIHNRLTRRRTVAKTLVDYQRACIIVSVVRANRIRPPIKRNQTMNEATKSQPMRVGQMQARLAELEAALREIAARGPVAGHASADALRLRLVGSQSIARAALKVAP